MSPPAAFGSDRSHNEMSIPALVIGGELAEEGDLNLEWVLSLLTRSGGYIFLLPSFPPGEAPQTG